MWISRWLARPALDRTAQLSLRNLSTLAGRKKILSQSTPDSGIFTLSSELAEFKGHKVRPCVSATTCEEYSLSKAVNVLQDKGISFSELVPGEALGFHKDHHSVFLLKHGTLVGWGIPEKDFVDQVVSMFAQCTANEYELQTEDVDYIVEEDQHSHVEQEIICLAGEKLADKLAFSFGISRSTRLAVLENSVERHTATTKDTTERLARGERLGVSPREVMKNSGRLLVLRGKLNLYSELVEAPDLYWAQPELERMYNEVSEILEIEQRTRILNRKLDYLSDQSTALVEIMNKRKEHSLERIVIYLIVIEVCFEIHHYYERHR